jgi:hypothetical protein
LIALETPSRRECRGGTYKYLPADFLLGKKNAPETDVYAVGLMMFNLEMADLDIEDISGIMGVVNYGIEEYYKNNSDQEFDDYMQSKLNFLEKKRWYMIMQSL